MAAASARCSAAAAVVAGPGQGQAQAELGVVVGRAGLDDPAEVARRVGVPPASNWARARASQHAAGLRLGRGGPLEQLGGRRGAAPARAGPGRAGTRSIGVAVRLPSAASGEPALRPSGNPGRRSDPSDICADPSVRPPASRPRRDRPRPGAVPRRPLRPGPGQRARRGHLSTVRRHRQRERGPVAGRRPAQRGPADPAAGTTAGQPGSSGDDAAARPAAVAGRRDPGARRRARACTSTSRSARPDGRPDRLQRGLIGARAAGPARGRDRAAARGRRAGPGGRAAGS